MRKNCQKVNSPDIWSATLENLPYSKSFSSACIYWPTVWMLSCWKLALYHNVVPITDPFWPKCCWICKQSCKWTYFLGVSFLFFFFFKHVYVMLPENNKFWHLPQMDQFFRVARTKLRLGAAAFLSIKLCSTAILYFFKLNLTDFHMNCNTFRGCRRWGSHFRISNQHK